jgi:hypothetical protein
MRRGIRGVAALLVSVLPLAGCLDWLDVVDQVRPKPQSGMSEPVQGLPGPTEDPGGSAPLTALCGMDRFAEEVAVACAQERGVCEQRAECASIAASFEDCLVERDTTCAQRAQFSLESGSCFVPQWAAANAENGCYDGYRQTLGACLLPTLEEVTVLHGPCVDEWSPGDIEEGGACLYGAFGCAAADRPGLRSICAYESSFEVGGGSCLWTVNVPRGAACDPGESAYCNRTDGCLSSGICAERGALGANCEVDNDCASLLCAERVCTDPEGFSCAERSCPPLWSCQDDSCRRAVRL